MLTTINEISQSRSIISAFGGYNHTENVGENQFYDMKNLTTDNYPALSSRKAREFVKRMDKPNALSYADNLCYVDGTELFYKSEKLFDVEDSEKNIVKMGAYLVIFPDKVCYNTDTDEYFPLEAHYAAHGTIHVEPSTYDGGLLSYSTDKPEEEDGSYWLDGTVLKVYSATYDSWIPVATSYVRISETVNGQFNAGFGDGFAEGDTVTMSGFGDGDLNGDFELYRCENGYMVIGSTPKNIAQDRLGQGAVCFDRTIPDMDFVIELNNRLWGCGKHEIYASKLGDPSNWRSYSDRADASYSVTVGSFGEFTGAVAFNGSALFFKEGAVISIYGTQPSDFTMHETSASGVEKGSSRSIATLNGTLYYKSKEGVMAYSGGIPVRISGALGGRYTDAVGGVTADKYYVSMMDTHGDYSLFAYDTVRDIWMREDGSRVMYFAGNAGTLYYIDCDGLHMISNRSGKTVCPSVLVNIRGRYVQLCPGMSCPGQVFEDEYSEDIEWYAETGDMSCELPDKKYVSSISVRLRTDKYMKIMIMYDGDGLWETIAEVNRGMKRTVSIPVRIRRCDFFRLRISGEGDFRVYSIARSIERGSSI